MTDVKYPDVHVELSEQDGNVFSIIGRVDNAMRRAGVPADERAAYRNEMFSSPSYDAALQTTMRWVSWS